MYRSNNKYPPILTPRIIIIFLSTSFSLVVGCVRFLFWSRKVGSLFSQDMVVWLTIGNNSPVVSSLLRSGSIYKVKLILYTCGMLMERFFLLRSRRESLSSTQARKKKCTSEKNERFIRHFLRHDVTSIENGFWCRYD
jgi:hypothetical protein